MWHPIQLPEQGRGCVKAYLGTVRLTVHGLDGGREVPAAVPMLVRGIRPGSPAVARP